MTRTNLGSCLDAKKLQFESNMLGKKIAYLDYFQGKNLKNLDLTVSYARKKGFDIIAAQIPLNQLDTIDLMTGQGFKVKGTKLLLINRLEKDYHSDDKIREATPQDRKKLRQISSGAFRYAHWYNHSEIPLEKIDKLYVQWIENAMNGRADKIFVFTKGAELQGYISCILEGKLGIIDLIAVSPDTRGRGIGKKLLQTALFYFKDVGATEVQVWTELLNLRSVNLYIALDFKIISTKLNINMAL